MLPGTGMIQSGPPDSTPTVVHQFPAHRLQQQTVDGSAISLDFFTLVPADAGPGRATVQLFELWSPSAGPRDE